MRWGSIRLRCDGPISSAHLTARSTTCRSIRADWPNASTVIPPLFTDEGGWNLSHVKDAAFEAKIETAFAELDRAKQATIWQELNKYATENVFAIPTFFGRSQTIAGTGVGTGIGTGVGQLYRWAAYGSWPYAQLFVKG